MRFDMTRGSILPDYELLDHENNPCRRNELQGDDPMILTLAPRALLPERAPAAPRARLA